MTFDQGDDDGPELTSARTNLLGRFAGAPAIAPAAETTNTVRRFLRRFRPERARLGAILATTVGSVVLSVLGPLMLGKATDVIVRGLLGRTVDFAELRAVLFAALGLYTGAWLLGLVQGWLLAAVVQRTLQRLRTDVERKIHSLPLSYLDRMSTGDLLSRVTNDIDNMNQTLVFSASQMLTALLTVVGIAVMMLVISPIVAAFSLVLIPLSSVVVRFVSHWSRSRFAEQWKLTGGLNSHVEEAFTGHSVVAAFGREEAMEELFDATNDDLFGASLWAQVTVGVVRPVMTFLGNFNYVVVAVIGSLQVAAGALSVGDVQAFVQYSRQYTQPLQQLAHMLNTLQSGIASAERVFEFLDAPDELPDDADVAVLGPTRGRVAFEDVCFSYDPAAPLIEHLSLVGEPGQTVAIVGPTGAGKTTLVNLIMRFYDVRAGAITLDGVDIRLMRRSDLRSRIGMVLQDTWLLEGTIRENIAYGNPEAGDEEIFEAARIAYVDRFVHTLPDGYDTRVDEAGSNLSAGEIQLITIARAFLNDPAILILDEATSSVDTRTELLIQQAMRTLRHRRTSFVIAHRLSTIRDADLIVVMESGRIVEQATHDELLARGGRYFDLYAAQFAGEVTTPHRHDLRYSI